MIYKFKVQWGRLLAVAIATLFISLGLPNWKLFQTQALDVPENNLIAQNVSVLWNKGSFPVENFQSYTSGFGYRISPVTGERQFHNGLDLAAPRGSYIRNWWSGKVVEVSDDTACGTMISIQPGAWEHFYCHMEGYV
ncbi:MAG: M23 family metallopeptidase, partial [Waterburya sp.]